MDQLIHIPIRSFGDDIFYGNKLLTEINENGVKYLIGIAKQHSSNYFTLIIQTNNLTHSETLIVFFGLLASSKSFVKAGKITYPIFEKIVFYPSYLTQYITIPNLKYKKVGEGNFHLKCNLKEVRKNLLSKSVFTDYEFPLNFKFPLRDIQQFMSNVSRFTTFAKNYISIYVQSNLEKQYFLHIETKSPVKREQIHLSFFLNGLLFFAFDFSPSEAYKSQRFSIPKISPQKTDRKLIGIISLEASLSTEHIDFQFIPSIHSPQDLPPIVLTKRPLLTESFSENNNRAYNRLSLSVTSSAQSQRKKFSTTASPERRSLTIRRYNINLKPNTNFRDSDFQFKLNLPYLKNKPF